MVKIGNCGWNFAPLKPSDYNVKTKLQAYAKNLNVVEINSTFYKLPKLNTVEKWRNEVDEIFTDFEFTIKVNQEITHKKNFSKDCIEIFNSHKELATALRAKIFLFQCSASFTPSDENIDKLINFFDKIERNDFIFVLEVRWQDKWKEEIVKDLFKKLNVEQCVDPLRQNCFYSKNIKYFRLHGFGKRMYDYKFNDNELQKLYNIIKNETLSVYVFFNNYTAYEDAKRFEKILTG